MLGALYAMGTARCQFFFVTISVLAPAQKKSLLSIAPLSTEGQEVDEENVRDISEEGYNTLAIVLAVDDVFICVLLLMSHKKGFKPGVPSGLLSKVDRLQGRSNTTSKQ
jgi:hypothetical protein